MSPSFFLLFFTCSLFHYFRSSALTKSLAQANFKADEYMRMRLFGLVTLAMQKKDYQVLPKGF